MIVDWLTLIGGTFGALLPIANPFSTAPVFAALTRRDTPLRRNEQARRAALYMLMILIGALLIGALVMTFFGITLPALRIAGGMIIAKVGFGMLNPAVDQNLSDASKDEAMLKQDIAFVPIALPLLSGPGSIAVTIAMATEVEAAPEYLAIAAGILLVSFASWLVLRSSSRVAEAMGVNGMNALTRLMGLVLVCIGVQFIFMGLLEALSSPQIAQILIEAYGSR
ncbi:MAG: MarC family NAAT transporter [Pseudomonadales bacterium]|nr:MarC family NAAT transporter [Pseudomonadales bacterium]